MASDFLFGDRIDLFRFRQGRAQSTSTSSLASKGLKDVARLDHIRQRRGSRPLRWRNP